jgi:hypothetical protein
MRRRYLLALLSALCAVLAFPQAGLAEKRAFAVGINNYAVISRLSTAIEDASSISKALGELGFKVETLKDPTRVEFAKRWSDFLSSLKPGDVAAFYFAGHGIQVDGANYLLPKDVPGFDAGETAILDKAVNFHQLMEELEARQLAATLYILDACRDNPFRSAAGKRKSTLGQTKGLARMEGVYGTFVMYSAGPDEEALDSLGAAAPKTPNSPYVTRLLPLLGSVQLSLVDIAKQVQVQVEQDVRAVSRQQRPAYFDGITGQYYLGQLDSSGRSLGPAERIPGDNVVRVGAFATWDGNCKSRPAPRITATSTQRFGRILTRYETFPVGETQFGNACNKSTQRGVGVYYVIDSGSAESNGIEKVQLAVKHWSVAPVTTVDETYEIDLATRYSKRITKR